MATSTFCYAAGKQLPAAPRARISRSHEGKEEFTGNTVFLWLSPCTCSVTSGFSGNHQDDHRGHDKPEDDQRLGYGLEDDDRSHCLWPFSDRSRSCCANPGLRPPGAYGATGKCDSSSNRDFPTNHIDTSL